MTAHTPAASLPAIIQGGMGVAVSSWPLARELSAAGQLGVVSGTAFDSVLARRLQDGDRGLPPALAHLPLPGVADRIVDRYFRAVVVRRRPLRTGAELSVRPLRARQELAVAGNFVEVWLAKEGHDGPIGINYLEKVQMATPAAAYGAMLAGVDAVLMSAGIPAGDAAAADPPRRARVSEHAARRRRGRDGSYSATLDPRQLSAGLSRRPAAAPGLPGHHLRARPRRLPHPRPGDPPRSLHHRGSYGRWAQRSTARAADLGRGRPARLWPPRPP